MGYAFGSTFVTRESKAMEHQNTHPRSQREYEMQRARLQAEIDKLVSESRKLRKEATWHPFVAGAAFMGGILALLKLLMQH